MDQNVPFISREEIRIYYIYKTLSSESVFLQIVRNRKIKRIYFLI